jgi:hypothetical protein
MYLKPAHYVTHLMGGVRQAAKKLKYSPSAVSRWRTLDGEVPTKARKKILIYAQKNKLDITANDLEYGRMLKK